MSEPAIFAEWENSDDPVKRQHVANVRRIKAGGDPSFPSIGQQVLNLAGAAVEAVASGGKRATPEEQARRLAICGVCEHFVGGKCSQCGCALRWKVWLEAWRCPIDKW